MPLKNHPQAEMFGLNCSEGQDKSQPVVASKLEQRVRTGQTGTLYPTDFVLSGALILDRK